MPKPPTRGRRSIHCMTIGIVTAPDAIDSDTFRTPSSAQAIAGRNMPITGPGTGSPGASRTAQPINWHPTGRTP